MDSIVRHGQILIRIKFISDIYLLQLYGICLQIPLRLTMNEQMRVGEDQNPLVRPLRRRMNKMHRHFIYYPAALCYCSPVIITK